MIDENHHPQHSNVDIHGVKEIDIIITDEPVMTGTKSSRVLDVLLARNAIEASTRQQHENDRHQQHHREKDLTLEQLRQQNEQQEQRQVLQQSPVKESASSSSNSNTIVCRHSTILYKEISKGVIRSKLMKRRHLVMTDVISSLYLDSIFPNMLPLFIPQIVHYNGGIAGITEWKISCYLEVMDGGIPTTNPSIELLHLFQPLLDVCNDLFLHWYKQQHSCNNPNNHRKTATSCERLMTFITRYTPAPGEQALLKHVDGAGKVDGSVVIALPVDRWSASYQTNQFEGGGLTFWDGNDPLTGKRPAEIHYDTRSGDVAFIDRAVWHQADPITKGTRWALVIFYKVS